MKQTICTFIQTIQYCLQISWKASPLYTCVRLFGKMAIPFISIISSFILKQIIDLLSVPSAQKDVYWQFLQLLIVITSLKLVSVLLNKWVSYCEGMHENLLDRYISLNMMEQALCAKMEMYDNPLFYDKFTSVKTDSYAITYILWNVLDFVSACISFFGATIVLASTNWIYSILIILASFPSAIVTQRYTKVLYQLGLSQVNDERKKSYLYEIASSKYYAQEIRTFGIGDMLKKRYVNLWNSIYAVKKQKVKSKTVLTICFELLPELVIAFVTFQTGFQILEGKLTVGDYTLYSSLLASLWSSITILTMSAGTIYENKLKIDNVRSFNFTQMKPEEIGKQILLEVKSIEFVNVSFAYPQSQDLVLKNLSFSIKKGEKVAVVGINGSGKSTLIKLLLRLYDPSEGQILINGIDIRNFSINSLRRCFCCYFQNAPNYGFTIKENVQFGDIDKKDDLQEINRAIQNSDGEEILKKAPYGLETYLTKIFEEKGIELSGGENQKIALARTFYRNSSCFILDEPSSNLDPEAEYRIFEQLEMLCKGKTTLFTSHRLSNISLADRIIVIENGTVIESGTKESLLKNPKRFAELFDYQMQKLTN